MELSSQPAAQHRECQPVGLDSHWQEISTARVKITLGGHGPEKLQSFRTRSCDETGD
jgi:hypothetical protein